MHILTEYTTNNTMLYNTSSYQNAIYDFLKREDHFAMKKKVNVALYNFRNYVTVIVTARTRIFIIDPVP